MRVTYASSAIALMLMVMSSTAAAMFPDDPLLTKVMSEFKLKDAEEGTELEWEIDAWMGRDLSKFWLKSEGETAFSKDKGNIELGYRHAVSAYWDQQWGIRRDLKSDSELADRTWVSFGFTGTAPYFIDVDARLFLGESSSTQLVIELEKEMMITQEWVLTLEADVIANGRTNVLYEEGSGLAEVEFGVKLGYERNGNRKFQPFFGLTSTNKLGKTRDLVRESDEKPHNLSAILGLHSWF